MTTDDLRFRVLWQGEEVANLPIKDLGDEAPEYDRPWTSPWRQRALDRQRHAADGCRRRAAQAASARPSISSRRWVYEQYDTLIQGNSLQRPGGDAGVIRVEGHPTKALAFSSDVNPALLRGRPLSRAASRRSPNAGAT